MFLGFGSGNNKWNNALQGEDGKKIERVRSAQITSATGLELFGTYCLEMTGE
jgi:hypothetical protein